MWILLAAWLAALLVFASGAKTAPCLPRRARRLVVEVGAVVVESPGRDKSVARSPFQLVGIGEWPRRPGE